jgi:hypothetical protein
MGMVAESNPVIRLEMPSSDTLEDLMNQIHTWLDARKIETTLLKLKYAPGGKIVLEIAFAAPHIADIFRREFAEGLPV